MRIAVGSVTVRARYLVAASLLGACGGAPTAPSPSGAGGVAAHAGTSSGGTGGSTAGVAGVVTAGVGGTGAGGSPSSSGAAGSSGSGVSLGGAGTQNNGGTGGSAGFPAGGDSGAGGSADGSGGSVAGAGASGTSAGGGTAAGAGAGGSAGAGAGGSAGAEALSFARDIWPVFDQIRDPVFVYRGAGSYENCTTIGVCHGGEEPGADLHMPDAPTTYAELLNVPAVSILCGETIRVVPGNPDDSCLIQFYVGRLKDDLEWVDQAEVDLVRRWIAEGALP
jgi:hypothetical protein